MPKEIEGNHMHDMILYSCPSYYKLYFIDLRYGIVQKCSITKVFRSVHRRKPEKTIEKQHQNTVWPWL